MICVTTGTIRSVHYVFCVALSETERLLAAAVASASSATASASAAASAAVTAVTAARATAAVASATASHSSGNRRHGHRDRRESLGVHKITSFLFGFANPSCAIRISTQDRLKQNSVA